MNKEKEEWLREGTRKAYSAAAERPLDEHPFPVGVQFAESLGYSHELLSSLPSASIEAFSGVSNVSIFADIPMGCVVLDLGCGAGLDCFYAARRTGTTGRVIGVDFSLSMLLRAQKAATTINTKNVEFYQADGENLPIGKASIDIAIVNGIFNLNPKREAIFHELARVLKSGGKLYAAELILKAPLPPEVRESNTNWFA
jgi:SAM-dependent methyltransferase